MKPLSGRILVCAVIIAALSGCEVTDGGLAKPADDEPAKTSRLDAAAARSDAAAGAGAGPTTKDSAGASVDEVDSSSGGKDGPVPAGADAAPPAPPVGPDAADVVAKDTAPPSPPDVAPNPPADVAPPPPPPPAKSALVITSAAPASAGDQAIVKRLETLGFSPVTLAVVKSVADGQSAAKQAAKHKLIWISSTLDSTLGAGPLLRDVPVPIVVNESGVFDDLGLVTGDSQVGTTDSNKVQIVAPTSPLAARLKGTVTVAPAPRTMAWGRPVADGIVVAHIAGNAMQPLISVFDAGAQLQGLRAPARRVMFFVHDSLVGTLNADGWKLFDEAAQWAASSP